MRKAFTTLTCILAGIGFLACGGGGGGSSAQTGPVANPPGDNGGGGNPPTMLLWSDVATWGNAKPGAGEVVTIPAGSEVMLDEDTPELGGLVIDGKLSFAREDLNLTSEYIVLRGELEIGTEAAPFTHDATITLNDTDSAASIMGMGTRGLMVMGGELNLYGDAPSTQWTQINAHVQPGANTIELKELSGWQVGDEIALAPTDFYNVSATESFHITAVNGTTLTLDAAVQDFRWGMLQYVTQAGVETTDDFSVTPPTVNTPKVLDERAEVMNLSRNIVIQAPDDALWQNNNFGAHVMIMAGGEAHVDGVEFRRVGQSGLLGRYGFHWHMLSYDGTALTSDTTGQFLRNSVINQSASRGIVVHGTNGLMIQNNNVFDTRGHAVFTEDAVERRNTFDGNVVMHVRDPYQGTALKLHENRQNGQSAGGASGFWLSNPDNIITNNVAVDTGNFGFWLAYPDNPWGLNIGVPMKPNRILFGVFDDNRTHTNRKEGLMFDNVEISNDGSVFPRQYFSTTDELDPHWPYNELKRFSINRFTTFKNGRGGIWDRLALVDFREIVSADNSGRFFAGSGAEGVIEHSLVVGNSMNNFSPRASFFDADGGDETPVAFATYHSAFSMRENLIVNFPVIDDKRSGAFATEDYYIRPVDKGQVNNENNMLIQSHPGRRSFSPYAHYVLAGALWDPNGTWPGTPGKFLVYNEPFFTFGQTPEVINPGTDIVDGVKVDGPFYGVRRPVINNLRHYSHPLMAIEAQRLDPADLSVVDTWSVAEAQENWVLSPMRHFAAHADGIYTLRFPGHVMPTDLSVRFENMLSDTDTLVVGLEFDGNTTPNNVYLQSPGSVHGYTGVNSLAEVRASAGETFWQDTANNMVWVKVRGGRWLFWDQTFTMDSPSDMDLLYEEVVIHINTDP